MDNTENYFFCINWIELSDLFQRFIIYKMLDCFGREDLKYKTQTIKNIENRFTKNSCLIWLYYNKLGIQGICISWKCNKFIFLDKFFTLINKTGNGTKMLNNFISSNINYCKDLIWRTSKPTSKFYLKNSHVRKYFDLSETRDIKNDENNNNIKIYLGVSMGNKYWEYEDIYDLKVESCFV